jgi:LysR family transcriptional regulator, glycine cleavage system transcriptional activator
LGKARIKNMLNPPELSASARHHRPLTLAGLRGFESAARHLSLTRAALELNLTQSAISRQVQGLEEELGIALFVRKAREILLTTEGVAFLPHVQRMLAELDGCVERMRRDAFSPRITLSTFASFASLWLIPRLPSFRLLRPTADIEIGATDRQLDMELENIDVAIRYLRHEAAPINAELLLDELIFPIVGPNYLKTAPPLRTLDDLAKHTLIESSPGGPAEFRSTWSEFFHVLGMDDVHGRSQLRFNFIVQTLMAAQSGQGVALSRTYGADMSMSGQLVRPFDVSMASGSGCYLIVSPRGARRPDVQLFIEWLRAEVAKFNGEFAAWLKKTGAAPARKSKRTR